uniref:DNA primase n=1 Tax=Pithovirus LCPAC001 TaxID=2506585 RepID=A0A481Z3V5_9VIRU|nr:MAG: DNA primase [Pithovirus LCPAC001]
MISKKLKIPKMTKVIHNQKWFYYLRRKKADPNRVCLENHYGLDKLKKGLIVCQKTNYILFTYFDSLDSFLNYTELIPHYFHNFYETIVLREQKPHFDVDIDLKNGDVDDKKIIRDLISAIITVMDEYLIKFDPIKDILLFHSNGQFKKSYHLIIDHHYHKNNIEAFCFYEKVLESMSPSNAIYIDSAVYKTVQQFRMLGSKKYKTERTKKYIKRYGYVPENLPLASLISYIKDSKLLPEFASEEEEEDFYKNSVVISNDLVADAMNMLETYLGINKNSPEFPFVYDTMSDPFIILKRVRPSMCEMCSRVHDNENPYMFVSKSGLLYFSCRREKDRKKILGRIHSGVIDNSQEIEIKPKDIPETKTEIIPTIKIGAKIFNIIRSKNTKTISEDSKLVGLEEPNRILESLINFSKKTTYKIKRSHTLLVKSK